MWITIKSDRNEDVMCLKDIIRLNIFDDCRYFIYFKLLDTYEKVEVNKVEYNRVKKLVMEQMDQMGQEINLGDIIKDAIKESLHTDPIEDLEI